MWKHRVFCALVLAAIPATLRAQGWTLDAYAGRATYDAVASAVGARNAGLAVRYEDPETGWAYLTTAIPLEAGDPSWVAAGGSLRPHLDRGPWSMGVHLRADGYFYRDEVLAANGLGGTLEALPFLARSARSVRAEVASGVVQSWRSFADAPQHRTLHRTDLRVSVGRSVGATAEARYLRASEASYPYLGFSGYAGTGRVTAWAAGGGWLSDRLPDDFAWQVGTSVEVVTAVDLWGAIRQEVTDPLYWTAPRRSWDVGVSWRPGRPAPVEPTPAPPVASEGRLTILLPVEGARDAPMVAGDFTGWNRVPMQLVGREWIVHFDVGPGVYRYSFVDAEGEWFVPEGLPGRQDDGMGGHVAFVIVP